MAMKNVLWPYTAAHDGSPATKARMAVPTSAGRSCWARWPAPSIVTTVPPSMRVATSWGTWIGTALSKAPCTWMIGATTSGSQGRGRRSLVPRTERRYGVMRRGSVEPSTSEARRWPGRCTCCRLTRRSWTPGRWQGCGDGCGGSRRGSAPSGSGRDRRARRPRRRGLPLCRRPRKRTGCRPSCLRTPVGPRRGGR